MGRDGCCGKVLPGWSPAVGAVVGAESTYISLNRLGGCVYIFYDKVSYHVHPPSPITWFVQIDRSDNVSIDDLMQTTPSGGHLN